MRYRHVSREWLSFCHKELVILLHAQQCSVDHFFYILVLCDLWALTENTTYADDSGCIYSYEQAPLDQVCKLFSNM